ncbi:MAG: hypothetical protein HOV83_41760 [Catenulispora sp.]|nr:hypothetical protein [Catenulispora sp.]
MGTPQNCTSRTTRGDEPCDRDAVLQVLGEMNTAIREVQIDTARHTGPDDYTKQQILQDIREAHGLAVLEALPAWIAALTGAVGSRTWTIVYRHHGADHASIDAIVGPDLHHALLARALARHPDWASIPDDQAVTRLLSEDWPGATAIPGEHTAFIFGGTDD